MNKGYQTWVGIAVGLLVLAAVFGGAATLLGGDVFALGGDDLAAGDDVEVAADGAPASPDLDPDSNSDGAASAASSGPALRVVIPPVEATEEPSTTSTSTTLATTASTAAESTTTVTESTVAESMEGDSPAEADTTASTDQATTESTETTQETSTTMAEAGPTTSVVTSDARSFEQQVLALTNEARATHGCQSLTHNDKLHAAALGHSKDMNQNGYFDHDSPDGSDFSERIERQGYRWRRVGENIALNYQTPQAVVDGWMNSPPHRENILNCDFTEIGIGFNNLYWTQNFGTPQ